MRKKLRITQLSALILTLALLLMGSFGCSGNGAGHLGESESTDSAPVPSGPSGTSGPIIPPAPAPNASSTRPSRPVSTTITLADNSIDIKGEGASANGSILTISSDGVYEISGTLTDGQILIDAPKKAKVELVLSGINVASSKNAAIYCKNCDDLFITLTENTQNIISDSPNYTYDDVAKEEPNATLFSKTDLNIGGTGWLTVNASFKHGIYTKDDLVIEGGGFVVNAPSDAVRGKDSVNILNGRFEITASGDGIKSSNKDSAELG